MERRLQNKVAESSTTLPVACVLMTLLWWIPTGSYSIEKFLSWAVCVVITIATLLQSDRYSLVRVSSRMNVVVCILLFAACPFLHSLVTGNLLVLSLLIVFLLLALSYDGHDSVTTVFYTGFFLSLGSMVWAPMLFLLPFVLWSQLVYMRCLSLRTFVAMLLGILVPYWLWMTVAAFRWDFNGLLDHAVTLFVPFHKPFYWQWLIDLIQTSDWAGFIAGSGQFFTALWRRHTPEMVASLYISILWLTGIIHYTNKSYQDATRVRMYYYTFILLQVVLALWLLLQPFFFYELFPLLILTTAPAASHFFAMQHTRLTNAWFILCTLGLVFVGVITLIQ